MCFFMLMMLISAGLEILGIGLVLPVIAILARPELIEQNKHIKVLYDIVKPSSLDNFLMLLLGNGFII